VGKAALGFAGLSARVPRANAGHVSLRPRPQGHALLRLTCVRVTNRVLRAHVWPRRLGEDSISLGQKMKELIGMSISFGPARPDRNPSLTLHLIRPTCLRTSVWKATLWVRWDL